MVTMPSECSCLFVLMIQYYYYTIILYDGSTTTVVPPIIELGCVILLYCTVVVLILLMSYRTVLYALNGKTRRTPTSQPAKGKGLSRDTSVGLVALLAALLRLYK